MKIEIINNLIYKIGENAKENNELLDLNPNYTWFHLKSFPSCHVILEKLNPNKDDIYIGGNLCLKNTKYKNLKNIKIYYTLLNNITRTNKIGSVCFKKKKKVCSLLV